MYKFLTDPPYLVNISESLIFKKMFLSFKGFSL